MQNRYTGDIGDFSKLGLLRALQAEGLSIGLNWYLTPDETHNSDGRHVKYLQQEEYRTCDEQLWLGLKSIVDENQRQVCYLETDNILKATFFSVCLDFTHKKRPERIADRSTWFDRSLDVLSGNDIICVDPDNGLIVPSALGRPKENKYVLPSELAGYYAQGSSVIYYQHKARRKDLFYIKQLDELLENQDFPDASGIALKFCPTSQRYYMCVIQPQHREAVERAIDHMLAGAWGKHFCLLASKDVHRG